MMKTIMRNLFVAAGFMFAVSVSAQETAPKASVSDFHVGDTIVIKKVLVRKCPNGSMT